MMFPNAVLFIFFILVTSIMADASNDSEVECSRTCVAENCDTMAMRYGKYCGAGYSGCPGENPCDDLDDCCKIHDNCVDINGLTNMECHVELKRCIGKVFKSGKLGFSKICPYDIVATTLDKCMDIAISFSKFDSPAQVEL